MSSGPQRIGIMTGGGDCPGLNAVLRAAVRTAEGKYGRTVLGYRHGWRGVVNGDSADLTPATLHGMLAVGGTMLGTSRYHPADHDGAINRALDTLARDHVGTLIVVGGDGTLAAARPLADAGVPIIGVPKTIDNDIPGTDRSVGFDTALMIATEAIDRIHTTAESHDRLMVVEVMGHRTGWLALAAGIAGGAHVILIPETPFDVDEVAARLRHRHQRTSFSIVVVAEGATTMQDGMNVDDPVTAGMAGERVRAALSERTGFESRLVVLGHVQRGGSPTPTDRLLATRFGVAAAQAAHDGHANVMTAVRGDEIALIPLDEATAGIRSVPKSLCEVAEALLG